MDRRWLLALVATVAAVAASAAPAFANMGVPWDPGDPVGEPAALDDVAIVRETLVLDMRPVAAGDAAHVAATYLVRNDGPALDAELVFASPGARDASVTIDGQPVSAEPVDRPGALPASWSPPATVPGIDGRPVEYHVGQPEAIRFPVAIPAGEHAIVVAYQAEPAAYHGGGSATREYGLAYTLAPARTWQSFGTLEVRVDVPSGWDAATSPSLERDGDTLTGRFEGLPADSLGITIRPPSGPLMPLGLAALVAGPVLLGALAWRGGRAARARGWGTVAGCSAMLGLAVGGALILPVVVALALTAEHSLATGGHPSRAWGYTAAYFVLGAGLLGFVVGAVAGPIGFALGHRAARGARRPVADRPARAPGGGRP